MSFSIPDCFVNNQRLKIAVVGAGGTASHLIQRLALLKRLIDTIQLEADEQPLCNLDRIDIFDSKLVNPHALARGLFTTGEVGINKAVALATRYNFMLDSDFFFPYQRNFDANECTNYDIIITCPDQAKIRVEIGELNLPNRLWLDLGVDRASYSVILGELSDSKIGRLPNALDLTDLRAVDDSVNREASCSVLESIERQKMFVNDMNATAGAALLSQLLLQGKITTNGCIGDIDTLQSIPLTISAETYLQFGWDHYVAHSSHNV